MKSLPISTFCKILALAVVAATATAHMAWALSSPPPHQPTKNTELQSRQRFLSVMAGGILSGSLVSSSSLIDSRDGFVASAAAPVNEACLSQCLYECTKPKGAEQKSRAECIPECKKKCKEAAAGAAGSS